MWIADPGLVVACVLLVGCLLALGRARLSPLRPAAGPPVRSRVLTGGAVAAALFAAQAGVVDHVEDAGGPAGVDLAVWTWFVEHRTGPVTAVATVLDIAGGTAVMAGLAALAALVLFVARHRVEAAAVLLATAGAAALVVGFKALYARPRPPEAQRLIEESGWSLPSGHAIGSTVVLGVLAAVAVLLLRRRAARIGAVAAAAMAVVAVGTSRLYLGVHWVSDVLTGWLLGGAWVAVCVTVLVVARARTAAVISSEQAPPAGTRAPAA